MNRFFHTWVSLLIVSGLLLAACAAPRAPSASPPAAPAAPSAPAPSEWGKVVEAAKKEGTVTVYNVLGTPLGEALKAGMGQYGIKVEVVGGTSADVMARITAEQRAKAYVASLVIDGSNWHIREAGFGEPVNVALPSLAQGDVWKIPRQKWDPSRTIFPYEYSITPSVIINTEQVKKGEIQSWQDLLGPKWRDRMVMSETRLGPGPGSAGLFAFMILGEDFWKKMAAQRMVFQRSVDLPVNQVALGEKALAIFPAYSRIVVAVRGGAPIQIVHLKEGTSYAVPGVNLLKNAPHPNAALVLLNWMLSKEGQAAIGRARDSYSVRKDVKVDWLGIPELNPEAFSLLEPPNNTDPAYVAKSADFAKKVFGPP